MNHYQEYKQYIVGNYKNITFVIDKDMYLIISQYSWHVTRKGYVATFVYPEHKRIFMHHLIIGKPNPPMYVDHINGDKLDNRKLNLRLCTNSQNAMNRKLQNNNTSGSVGVSWSKSVQKWCAYIKINQKRIHLGVFDDINEAIKVRKNAEILYFKEFRKKED